MYDVGFPKSTEKTLRKLKNKNPAAFEAVLSKIEEIQRDPHRYKNLKRPLQHLKRVHVDKSFVIIFSVDEVNKKVIIVKYAHHDKIYMNYLP